MRKRTLTLLEIMIVILLISIITGVIGYNMKGALDKGRAFRTERAIEQLKDLLLLQLAQGGSDPKQILKDIPSAIRDSGLANKPDELLKDGWGIPFEITLSNRGTEFKIESKKLNQYNKTHHIGQGEKRSSDEDDDI